MTEITTSFQLGDKLVTTTSTKKPKYRLTIDEETYELANADQIRAAVLASGRQISKNGVYQEMNGVRRGKNKETKLSGITIEKIPQTSAVPEDTHQEGQV